MRRVKPDPTKTMDVREAGRIYFGLGQNASYEAAHRGEIPTIKIGGRIRAIAPAIERMLEQAGRRKPDPGEKLNAKPAKHDTAA